MSISESELRRKDRGFEPRNQLARSVWQPAWQNAPIGFESPNAEDCEPFFDRCKPNPETAHPKCIVGATAEDPTWLRIEKRNSESQENRSSSDTNCDFEPQTDTPEVSADPKGRTPNLASYRKTNLRAPGGSLIQANRPWLRTAKPVQLMCPYPGSECAPIGFESKNITTQPTPAVHHTYQTLASNRKTHSPACGPRGLEPLGAASTLTRPSRPTPPSP